MPDYLFVYGTLRRANAHPIARALHAQAEHLGTAYAAGCLFDLGRYPGALFGSQYPGKITGDVFALPAPSRLLPILDDYEGLVDATPGGEYVRARIPVCLARGTRLLAWTYALFERPKAGRPIASGEWK